MQISYSHHGNRLIFQRNADGIQLLGLFEKSLTPSNLEAGSILEMQVNTTYGVKGLKTDSRHLLLADRMALMAIVEDERYHGNLVVVILKDPITGILAEVNYLLSTGSPTIRTWVRVRNDGPISIRLERIYSAVLHNLAACGQQPWHEKTCLHVWYKSPNGAKRWRRARERQGSMVKERHSFPPYGQSVKGGNWANPTVLPMGVLEDVETRTSWYWQIEYSRIWNWELSETKGKQLSFCAQAQNVSQCGWQVQLQPGDAFKTAPVAFGSVRGGSEDAWRALADYRQQVFRRNRCSLRGYG
ncbi:MAG: hypothetical protein GX322_05130 [Firmicutes bacterium]|nr:hypothetical protein [Bacillota bacterium]